jgi:hypothetical protein
MPKTSPLTASLMAFAGFKPADKTARLKEDHPEVDLALQRIVGDPSLGSRSLLGQSSPATGDSRIPNPLSPIEGDDIFFTGLIPGARFQSHDGQWWDILEYDWEGKVTIQNCMYPRRGGIVSIQSVRQSIYSWLEPISQVVPPPPPGVDYGTLEVRIVE